MSCYLFLEAHLQVLGEETFRDKLISWLILASNESYCCVCFDLKTVSPPDCNTSDNNSQSLPSNRSIRIVFSMYFFAVSFIIMYSLLKFSLCFFFKFKGLDSQPPQSLPQLLQPHLHQYLQPHPNQLFPNRNALVALIIVLGNMEP